MRCRSLLSLCPGAKHVSARNFFAFYERLWF
ncbi:hypothetical protein GLW08_16345 [Pontibacillus yanchengensis]|uniref:Uncharacterized protein n=2 Tax=Pontibacillus yanchengensis TaxID=462910 RepID=A0ACC7VIY1_9BACI|nr:hypothetical protein [Pontibacillus yanchengensis]MYL54906.1 hypothetical protein [Pontibacillus yanchengensis]